MDFPFVTIGKKEENSKARALTQRVNVETTQGKEPGKEGAESVAVRALGSPPCNRACPAGIDAKRYVSLIADGRFAEAEAVIRDQNPMGAVCGWICSRPCERECTRSDEEGTPVSLRALQRFACTFVADSGMRCEPVEVKPNGKKVAVVGAGPSGLSAARDLALAGCGVTVWDRREVAGGLLAHEVPAFRLPREVLRQDVEALQALGVGFELGEEVTGERLEELEREYDAVIVATGAHRGLKGGLKGEDGLSGVVDALTVLRASAEGRPLPSARTALVVGSASYAVSTARCLAREGVEYVFLVFPQPKEKMAADIEEILAAQGEGVKLLAGHYPQEVEGRSGRFSGLLCRRVKNPDEATKPLGRVSFELGDEERFDAELLVWALDREVESSLVEGAAALSSGPLGTLEADPATGALGSHGVFGAGEAVTGPRGVVEAVASGRRAARFVLCRLFEEDSSDPKSPRSALTGRPWELGRRFQEPEASNAGFRLGLPGESRGRVGDEGDPNPLPGDPREARAHATMEFRAQEAARQCLRCGPCVHCGSCSVHCPDGFILTHGDHELVRADRQVALAPEDLDGRLLLAKVDANTCRGCGTCERICPYHAPRVRFGPKRSVSVIDADYCRGCGKCVAHCPTGAIHYPLYPAHLIEE